MLTHRPIHNSVSPQNRCRLRLENLARLVPCLRGSQKSDSVETREPFSACHAYGLLSLHVPNARGLTRLRETSSFYRTDYTMIVVLPSTSFDCDVLQPFSPIQQNMDPEDITALLQHNKHSTFMPIRPSSPSPKTHITSPQFRKPPRSRGRKRSSRACVSCRSRKVRCDIIQHGAPCSNCRLDCVECKLAMSKRQLRYGVRRLE